MQIAISGRGEALEGVSRHTPVPVCANMCKQPMGLFEGKLTGNHA